MRSGADDGLQVRAVGAGHSFTPVAASNGVHLHLDRLNAFERVVPQPDGTTHVTVGAGIRLGALNAELAARGLGMRNLGDIDKQSIAGAISTGTHGTGARLGGLATQVVGARIVTAKGEVLETCPESNPELFELARLGLGSVGVLSAVTLEVVPAFKLEAVEEPWHLDRVLERLDGPDGLVEGNDHFEFYWFPHTRRALTKRNNRVPDDDRAPAEPGPRLDRRRAAVQRRVRRHEHAGHDRPADHRTRSTTSPARALSSRRFVAPAPEVFVSPRRVRFREMEYAVPRDQLVPVLAEIDRWLEASGEHVPFPVEVRFAAADDLWLSTAHGRETAYIAVHQYIRRPFEAYFRAVEKIVAAVDGRPHWGKMHWLEADRLGELYPRFADAQRVRQQADPDGVFSSPYLARLFGA